MELLSSKRAFQDVARHEQTRKSALSDDIRRETRIGKQDYTNTIKQLKDQMTSNLNNLNEKMDSGYSKNNNEILTSACFYCAKPNHRYTDCNSASPSEKDKISNMLREKKFDFVKLNERAKAFIKNRRQNTSTTAFNPGSPTHSGF